ncbi:MAG: hypothetical protein HOB22_04030 [Candidatus Marinimicrobia bacterium]|jgi:hypothetical protein|nr:hypothetical protein [Candidatus Neomarinimicrobiota bacterium]MBT6516358.1 hypothetical protein [Candidatus Neomarinimicrobiota bacterium]MBT6710862.1 hypothetical protein [Candidatus Neomarinimicrobiota bacterium]
MIGESKISNQKTLLIGLLVTAVAIVLFETGTLKPDQNTFQAQSDMVGLVLNNNNVESAFIDVGSSIILTNKFESENFIAGTLLDVENGVILIKNYIDDETLPFVISDVGSVVYGESKAVGKYFFKGLKYGAIGGLASGTALWLLIVADGGFDPIEAYPYCVGFVSMFTIPAGALGGLIKGAIKQGKAIEYIIGPNDWQIVQ